MVFKTLFIFFVVIRNQFLVRALDRFRSSDYYRRIIDNETTANKNNKKGVVSSEFLSSLSSSPKAWNEVDELYFTQRLDHYESSRRRKDDLQTFSQRYFYSDVYVIKNEEKKRMIRSKDPPTTTKEEEEEKEEEESLAFLCVGGEGPPLDKSVLVNSVHCTGDMLESARRLYEKGISVHLFALEHRYYGKSYPKFPLDFGKNTHDKYSNKKKRGRMLEDNDDNDDDNDEAKKSALTTENLVYLSSNQALADIAHFISSMNNHPMYSQSQSQSQSRRQDMNNNNVKWVTFGSSYPGMLSAWARLKFPHLIHAAVSNSSPVQTKLDFGEYKDHDAWALREETIGGSQQCLDIIQDGHARVAEIFDNANNHSSVVEELASMFHVCDGAATLHVPRNVQLFLGDGLLSIPTQSNDPSCTEPLCNIEKICKAIIKVHDITKSSIQSLAAISKAQEGENCFFCNFENLIKSLSSWKAGETRSWIWQTCTEFGFYQTCEKSSSSCPYGRGYHNLDMDLEICQRLFGLTNTTIQSNVVIQSLEEYGGWDIKSSRIVFVNGNVDPWSILAVTGDRGTKDQPTYWVEGASHHFWTHSVRESSDGDDIVKARNFIYEQVVKFLDS